MTDHLPVRRSAWDLVRVPREVVRALAQAEQTAAIDAARVEAVAYVTATGLQAVANLAELEGRLITRSPLAEARLRFVGDVGAAKIAEIIERTRP